MASRMDRYKDENPKTYSRSSKNQELYQNIGNKTRYTSITDVTNANAIDLDNAKSRANTREGYHQIKEFNQNIQPVPRVKKELEDFNHLYKTRENRIYDVNRVLEEARKNRTETDEKEEKRKLKDSSYNIITSLNKEELEKYRKEKLNKVYRPDDDEIKELINTITSKTLAGEIDQATSVNLLSDLMATNVLDKVEKPEPEEDEEKPSPAKEDKQELSQEVLNKEQLEKVNEQASKLEEKTEEIVDENLKGADTDFYTRSMDLSDKDFEMDDEFKEKKMPVALKIILILIVLAVLGASAYFIWLTYFN